MKKILVPTDRSDNARSAFIYAQELALFMDASLKVVNVPPVDVNTSYPHLPNDLDAVTESHKKLLADFVAGSMDKDIAGVMTETQVEQEVIIGFATEEIIRLSYTDEADIIVMGTRGKGGMFNNLLGSVSSIIAREAACPVMLIPEGCTFKDPRNMMYASDFKTATTQILEKIAEMAALFTAKVHLVHVQSESSKSDEFSFEEQVMDQIMEERAPKVEIEYVTIVDTDVWHGLQVYSQDQGMDLLVLVTPKRKFWDRITHKSITKQMITSLKVPLLVLHSKK